MLDSLKYGKFLFSNNIDATTNYYRYNNQQSTKTEVMVVGCGGTGGRLIPMLAQHISNHNREILTNPRHRQWIKHEIGLTLIDMDVV